MTFLQSWPAGKHSRKIDLSQAYSQIPVQEESSKYLTVNTHKGLFKVTRLPFGISSAPGIFQRLMDCVVGDIPGVACYLDDIVVTGAEESEHIATVRKVLGRLRKAGLKVKSEKCAFMLPNITYLGHEIDATGIHPMSEKIRAIKEAPLPKNVTDLRAFLGIVNYYAKFYPNLSATLSPLVQADAEESTLEMGGRRSKGCGGS